MESIGPKTIVFLPFIANKDRNIQENPKYFQEEMRILLLSFLANNPRLNVQTPYSLSFLKSIYDWKREKMRLVLQEINFYSLFIFHQNNLIFPE